MIRCTIIRSLIPLLTATVLMGAGTAHGREDHPLTPWIRVLSEWGRGPGGEAWYHALDELRSGLPQAALRDALRGRDLRPSDPFAAAARDQILAELDREFGDLDAARARIHRLGFVLDWEVVLPERLAGVQLRGDPATGWVSPGDHLRFSGVEPVLLEAVVDVEAAGNVLVLTGGDGIDALDAAGAELRPGSSESSLLDQAGLCADLPSGAAVLRLSLRPDKAGRSFALRLVRPDGRPFPGKLRGEERACVPCPIEAWRTRLGTTAEAIGATRPSHNRERGATHPSHSGEPEGAAAGLWLLHEIDALRPTDGLLDGLSPETWLELEFLSRVLSDQRDRWETICARTPICAGAWQAEVIRGEVETRRGQSYQPLRRLRALEEQTRSSAPGYEARAALLHADLLQGLGLVRRALSMLPPAVEDSPPEQRAAWVNLQISAGNRELAMSALLAEHRRRPGAREGGSLLGTLLADAGRLEEAAAVWESMAALHPADPDLPMEQAMVLVRQGKTNEALALLDGLAPGAEANAGFWEQRGRILARDGRDEEATAAWRRALELEPQNPDLQDLLRRSAPGQRRWSTLRRSLAWAMARTGGGEGGQAVEGLADLRLVTIHPNGLLTIHRQQLLRVVDPDAAGELSLSALYDPHSEDLTTLSAAVLRGQGEVLQAPDGDDLSLSQEEFNLHYDLRERVRYFPKVQPGDVLVWETRLDQFRGARGGVSLVRALQEGYPKRLVEIVVQVPRTMELRYSVRIPDPGTTLEPERTEEGETVLYRWRLEDLPALLPRPFPPPTTERAAHMVLSTMRGWRHVVEWYRDLLAQQVIETAELTDQAEVFRQDPDGPLIATARFVADQVRYVGLEFGVNAYVPYPTARVFERRYGDCKDKSLLMVTFLRRLGIEAYVALVRTFPHGAMVEPPPSISLFDHAIVRIPGKDLWFDPTARYLGTGGLPWQNQGAQALILDDDPALETIPLAPATENRSEVRLILQEGGDQGLRISGLARFSGAQARSNYEVAQDPSEWDARVESFLSGILPGFRLLDAPWDIREASPPVLRVEVDGEVEVSVRGIAALGGLRFQPRLASLPQRTEDLVLRYPFEEEILLETDSPRLRFTGPTSLSGDGPGCRWSLVSDPGHVRVVISLPARRVTAEDYPRFRACLGALDTALTQVHGQMEEGP